MDIWVKFASMKYVKHGNRVINIAGTLRCKIFTPLSYVKMRSLCANNHMIVNEAKSKVMCLGKQPQFCMSFNHKEIEQIDRYKYLGTIIPRVDIHQQNIFADNYKYPCKQARKAIFCVKRKIQTIGALPPHVMFYIFETMIRPITTYGSDVWGCKVKNISCIDKELLEFSKRILRVKTTTCNTIVYGECGHLPPSVFAIWVHSLLRID